MHISITILMFYSPFNMVSVPVLCLHELTSLHVDEGCKEVSTSRINSARPVR